MIKLQAEICPLYDRGLFSLRLTLLDGRRDDATVVTSECCIEALSLFNKSLLDHAFDSLKEVLVKELTNRAFDWANCGANDAQ